MYEALLAELDGVSVEDYHREAAMRIRLAAIGEKYRRAPPSAWPELTFNWDLRPESQRFALDGMKSCDFEQSYPQGLVLGRVRVPEMDAALCHFNTRNDLQELWDCGFESSLCTMLAYLAEGLPITPPLVAVTPTNELCFHGGNHRYTAAKFSGLASIPIYVEPDNRSAVGGLVSVSWADT
jgi:hypothetical protein